MKSIENSIRKRISSKPDAEGQGKDGSGMKRYDFDNVIDRRGTNCGKWDTMDLKYGRRDLIHMGVADMDFSAPPEILDEFNRIVKAGVLGYTDVSEGFYKSIIHWYRTKYEIELKKEWIVFCPRINISCGICVGAFSKEGERIMMHSPAYGPLKSAVVKNNRILTLSPLVRSGDQYKIDFEQMEKSVTPDTKMLILCSPHNPTTRVFTKEELEKLGAFCIRHNLILFSDEIHGDIVKKGVQFLPAMSLSDEVKDRLILSTSLTKTFNIPGVIVSFMIIPNQRIRETIQGEIDRIGMHNPTIFAVGAVEKGYTECDLWREQLLNYLDENEKYVRAFLQKELPGFRILERQGTYLLWIDYTGLSITEEELEKWFIEEAGVSVYMGSTFGEDAKGYLRFNMACPRSLLREALEKMKKAFPKLKRH